MGPSLQITDDRWVHPCACPSLPMPTGQVRPHTRTVVVGLLHAFVCWQAKRLERRIKRFELDYRHST